MKNLVKVFMLPKYWIVALILLSVVSITSAQPVIEWNRTYGWKESDEWAYSIQQTKDGGYIVAGIREWETEFGPLTRDIYILKLDANGNINWEKTYGGEYYDEAYSIQQTSDGGYIVVGATQIVEEGYKLKGSEIYVLKLDSNGNIEWDRTYGGIAAYSVQQTSDGGYIVAGVTQSSEKGREVYILKLDSHGNIEWNRTYGGSGDDAARSIQQTKDGGYIVAGITALTGFHKGNEDIYVLKLDSNGNIEWEKTYGGRSYDAAASIQQTKDGGYIIVGTTYSLENSEDIYVLKLDSNGNVQWSRTYGGSDIDCACSIQQTSDGGYIVAGGIGLRKMKSDIYILKLNSDGHLEWEMTHGGSDEDFALSVQQTYDGGYVIAGGTKSFGNVGSSDVYVLKLSGERTPAITPKSTSTQTFKQLEKLYVSIQPKYIEAKPGDTNNYTVTINWYPPEWRGELSISAVISAAGFEKQYDFSSVTPTSNPPITLNIPISIPKFIPPLTYKLRLEVTADSLKASDETELKVLQSTPGFETVLAIAGLLAAAYLMKK